MSKFRKGSTGGFGNWMAVQVKFREDIVGCCPITDDGTVLTDGKSVIKVSKKNVPNNLFEGKHVIQLAEDKKSIKAFKPYSGQHPAKFIKFSSREDETAVPQTKHGEYGDYLVFFPIFEITGGPYKGCNASYQVAYKFQEGDDGVAEFAGTKGKFLEQLEEFLDTVIGSFDPPKFSDNLLPIFQKMASRADKSIGLVFKKGWIVTLVELEGNGGDAPPWKQTADKE